MIRPALLSLLLAAAVAPAAAAGSLPNILIIFADDLGYGDVGCYNPESKVATPSIDRLASQGLRFTDAHSPSTVCTPSRYSLFTGRMAFRTGLKGVFTGAGGPNMIEADRLTLPGMLKEKGYLTALIGKWHVGLTFRDSEGKPISDGGPEGEKRIDYSRPITDSPVHRGFDEFFGTACCPTTDWIYAYIEDDRVPNPPVAPIDKSTIPENPYTKDCRPGRIAPDFKMDEVDLKFLDRSLRFLDKHKSERPDQPFFLVHSTQAVHLPSIPAPEFVGKSGLGAHGDFIMELDAIVGRLMTKLDELGMSENTIVMLSSDNGPEIAPIVNMRADHGHDGARPWRGMKRDQWEGGHRVPFIVRWQGEIEAGSETSQTTCLTDIMATCASIIGYQLPNDAAEDSFDLLPLLKDPDLKDPIRPFTIHQTNRLELAIRSGKWKYLDHRGSGGNDYRKKPQLTPYILPEKAPDAPGQLYDMEKDPGETENLYLKHPEKVRELKEALERLKSSGRSAPLRSSPDE
ncbi:arylsulfatase [Haloferula helveola]|uniref:Arylsulfatase n=1 Tax=Haloferula helveola TaxID=490095 RepID=A0ABM7RIZ2_9BACT|nr:arylsulfatase [Haloferula helveola]